MKEYTATIYVPAEFNRYFSWVSSEVTDAVCSQWQLAKEKGYNLKINHWDRFGNPPQDETLESVFFEVKETTPDIANKGDPENAVLTATPETFDAVGEILYQVFVSVNAKRRRKNYAEIRLVTA